MWKYGRVVKAFDLKVSGQGIYYTLSLRVLSDQMGFPACVRIALLPQKVWPRG